MQDLNDIDLLKAYAEQGSEEAFAAIVHRHIGKVYSVALRRSNNPSHAEEITQVVFIILAQKAATLRADTILSGWLYQTARFATITHLRSEIRRSRREQESHMETISEPTASDDPWCQISPLLDDALAQLSAKDRAMILLRYFDGKSMKEVGDATCASEEAARKRVNRAVDKMRQFFSKRGVTVSAAVLVATISARSVQAAPVPLSKTVITAGLAKGAASSGSTLAIAKGALKLMSWAKAKLIIAVTVAAALAAGTTAVVITEIKRPSEIQFQGHPVTVLTEFDWQKLADEGRLTAGKIIKSGKQNVLQIGTLDSGSAFQLLNIQNPPITATNYAVIGEIKFEGVDGPGHLNMRSFFPPKDSGSQLVQYYSYTGAPGTGPDAQILGDSDWRVFALPLDRSGKTYPSSFVPQMDTTITVKPPSRLEVSVFLPNRGIIYLRNVKLVQWN